ncbi:MAG TPA: hypothetical protein VIO61_11400 [Anaerolineaceae bacterium]
MNQKKVFDWDNWKISILLMFAWLITSIGALFSGLYIREVILRIALFFQIASQQAYKRGGGIGFDFTPGRVVLVLDNIIAIAIAIAVVTSVILIEYYFRKGRSRGLLFKRIGIVIGIEAAIIVLSILILLFVI